MGERKFPHLSPKSQLQKGPNVSTTRKTNVFAEPIFEDEEEVIATPAPSADSDLKRSRIKGTWAMHWAGKTYNFEDGKTYTIPVGLFEHLKAHGNIYDTL